MGTYQIYKEINNSTIELLESFNPIAPPQEVKRVAYVRLEENPFKLTADTNAVKDIVTAHKLEQYRNRFKSIKLENNVTTWLDALLKIGKEED